MSKQLKWILPINLGLALGLLVVMVNVFKVFDERIGILQERITMIEERISLYELHN